MNVFGFIPVRRIHVSVFDHCRSWEIPHQRYIGMISARLSCLLLITFQNLLHRSTRSEFQFGFLIFLFSSSNDTDIWRWCYFGLFVSFRFFTSAANDEIELCSHSDYFAWLLSLVTSLKCVQCYSSLYCVFGETEWSIVFINISDVCSLVVHAHDYIIVYVDVIVRSSSSST